jgi:putative addiction module component (TIGR02574 family)
MVAAVDSIRQAFRGIPREEQADLIDQLILDMHAESPGLSDEWLEEIDRRCQELDSGAVKLIPWSEVRAELKKELEARG